MSRDIQILLKLLYSIPHQSYQFIYLLRMVIFCPWIVSFSKYSIDQFLSNKFSDEVNFSRIKLS